MKKIFLVLGLVFSMGSAFSKEASYVGYMWSKVDDKPIVLPLVFKNKNECMAKLKEMNDITERTIKITRQYDCSPVFPQ